MPLNIKTGVLKYKKPDGSYSNVDGLMSEASQEEIADIQSAGQAQITALQSEAQTQASAIQAAAQTAGQTQITAIQNKGTEIINSLPQDYTELEGEVSGLKSAIDPVLDTITREVSSKNLIDPSGIVVGQLKSPGNVDATKTAYKTSDYIFLKGGKTYLFIREKLTTAEGYAMGYSGYGLFNTSKEWVSDSLVWGNNGTSGLTISPQSDCYIRVCGGKDFFTDDNTARFILQEGTTLTGYEAYFAPYRVVEIEPDDIDGGENIEVIADVTATQSQINLYDKTLAVNGKYINAGSEIVYADWAWTGKIPVKPNTQYNISRDPASPMVLNTSVQEWAQDGTFIQSSTFGGYSYLTPIQTSPATYYISVNMSGASHTEQDFNDTIDTIMLCYGTQRPPTYSAYNAEAVLLSGKLDNGYFNPNVFGQKKWLALGTSITWYDSKAYSAGLHEGEICRGYIGNVARRKALLVTNEGISGSTLANVSESSLINRYQALDWAAYDIATIEYGVNDFGNAVAIGTAEDAAGTDTFAACLKTVIEYALAQNPKLCLVICTDPDVRGDTANSDGHYLHEYTDVTLAIAKQYRLPVCDWYYHSGINAVTKGSSSVDYLTADGTHPNDAGHLRMGAMLNQVFDSLIC